MKLVYYYLKIGTSSICFGVAAMLIAMGLSALKHDVSRWYASDGKDSLWRGLAACEADTARNYYVIVSKCLNKLLTEGYGVSLYVVNRSECTVNFQNLVNELDKLYQPEAVYNYESLKDLVKQFCKNRRYK
jgi:hypothetical protein